MLDWKKKIVFLGFGDTIAHPIKHPKGYGVVFYTSNKCITDIKEFIRKRKLELYFRDKYCLERLINQLTEFYNAIEKEENEDE